MTRSTRLPIILVAVLVVAGIVLIALALLSLNGGQTSSAAVGDTSSCGQAFEVKVLPQPVFKDQTATESASGKFLIVTVQATNQSDKPVTILPGAFQVIGNVNGKAVTFSEAVSASLSESFDNNLKSYTDALQPGLPRKTVVVFDVNPDGKDWRLVFNPRLSLRDKTPVCTTEIALGENLVAADSTTHSSSSPEESEAGIGDFVSCGDLWRIGAIEPVQFPLVAAAELPKGQYAKAYFLLKNLQDHTASLLGGGRLALIGKLNGRDVAFDATGIGTNVDEGSVGIVPWLDDIPPGIEVKALAVFDVNPAATNWRLRLSGNNCDAELALRGEQMPDLRLSSTSLATLSPTQPPVPTLVPTPAPTPLPGKLSVNSWEVEIEEIQTTDAITSSALNAVEKASGKFAVLILSVKNVGRSPDSFSDIGILQLQDPAGRTYESNMNATLFALTNAQYGVGLANPDQVARSIAVFDVPVDVTSFTLIPAGVLVSSNASGNIPFEIPPQ